MTMPYNIQFENAPVTNLQKIKKKDYIPVNRIVVPAS